MISWDPAFESGVVKIQNGQAAELTILEQVACQRLRVDAAAGRDVNETDEDEDYNARMMSPASMARATSAKRQRMLSHGHDEYVNCDYILGSVAPVERLWSMAKYVMPDYCSSLDPIHLEALLFLKINHSYWNLYTVDQAFHELRAEVEGEHGGATVARARSQESESESDSDESDM